MLAFHVFQAKLIIFLSLRQFLWKLTNKVQLLVTNFGDDHSPTDSISVYVGGAGYI